MILFVPLYVAREPPVVLVSLEMLGSLEFPGSRETGERQDRRDLAVTLELQE